MHSQDMHTRKRLARLVTDMVDLFKEHGITLYRLDQERFPTFCFEVEMGYGEEREYWGVNRDKDGKICVVKGSPDV